MGGILSDAWELAGTLKDTAKDMVEHPIDSLKRSFHFYADPAEKAAKDAANSLYKKVAPTAVQNLLPTIHDAKEALLHPADKVKAIVTTKLQEAVSGNPDLSHLFRDIQHGNFLGILSDIFDMFMHMMRGPIDMVSHLAKGPVDGAFHILEHPINFLEHPIDTIRGTEDIDVIGSNHYEKFMKGWNNTFDQILDVIPRAFNDLTGPVHHHTPFAPQ